MANLGDHETRTDRDEDPFESLMGLEHKNLVFVSPLHEVFLVFYQEGYAQGATDGARAGLIEGRVFGLEKGYEKYVAMGQLHGRAVVWGSRLYDKDATETVSPQSVANTETQQEGQAADRTPSLPVPSARLEKHIRTLFALVDPASLSTENTEESVSDFDDRLRRAKAKVKVIERLVGEDSGESVDKERKPQGVEKEHGRGVEI